MDCPACRKPLIVAEREGIELDCCPWCHGLWFDAGEFELLLGKLGLPAGAFDGSSLQLAATTEKTRLCPRCDRPMDKTFANPDRTIVLDRCAGHGMWFDRGELGRLVDLETAKLSTPHQAVISFLGERFRK